MVSVSDSALGSTQTRSSGGVLKFRPILACLASAPLLTLMVGQGHANAWPADEIAPVSSLEGDAGGLSFPSSTALGPDGLLYVANYRGNSVSVLEFDQNTNTLRLVRSLAGPRTEIRRPTAVALDSSGRLYVANTFGITSYDPGWESGDTPPDRSLAGPNTQIVDPTTIAFDSVGRMYVAAAYESRGTLPRILIFGTDWPSGDVAPIATLVGPGTGLDSPQSIAFDSQGRMYVANDRWISVHALGWRGGNLCPIALLAGPQTQLQRPQAITFDDHGFMIVANAGAADSARISIYAPDWPSRIDNFVFLRCDPSTPVPQSNPTPVDVLTGSKSKLDRVSGLAVLEEGLLVAASEGAHRLTLHTSTTQLIHIDKSPPGELRLSAAQATVGALSTSGLNVSIKAETPLVCTGQGLREVRLELNGTGTCRLTLSQQGDSRWSPAPTVTFSFSVLPSQQEIVVKSISRVALSKGRIFPQGAATSGLPLVWTSESADVCVATGAFGAKVRILNIGVCRLHNSTYPSNHEKVAPCSVQPGN